MSLILEALKKSEARRRLGEAPDLGTPFTPASRRRSALPLILLAIVVVAGFGSWYVYSSRIAPTPIPAAQPKGTGTANATAHAPAIITPNRTPVRSGIGARCKSRQRPPPLQPSPLSSKTSVRHIAFAPGPARQRFAPGRDRAGAAPASKARSRGKADAVHAQRRPSRLRGCRATTVGSSSDVHARCPEPGATTLGYAGSARDAAMLQMIKRSKVPKRRKPHLLLRHCRCTTSCH